MTRTMAREIAIQLCFAASATGDTPENTVQLFFDHEHYQTLKTEGKLYEAEPDETQRDYILRLVSLIGEHREEVDSIIRRYSRGWKLERISRTALAVLRCALCEIIYMDDIPDAAAINEAVELAKAYDEPDTVAFINGVLGSYMREREDREAET